MPEIVGGNVGVVVLDKVGCIQVEDCCGPVCCLQPRPIVPFGVVGPGWWLRCYWPCGRWCW